jgi:hypothetical protein
MHLTGTNSFSFSPSGLTILTQLSDETDKVRQLLQNKIEDYRKPHNFMLLFQGKTEVTDFIQTIGLKTNLEELFKLSTFSTTEANRTSQLDIEIAALKTLDIPKQLTKLRQTITDLDKLVKQLGEIDSNLNDKSIESVNNSITQYAARELLLTDTSLDQFKSKYFKQIGSETWQKFIILAKALADLESQPNSNYPQVNDRCLLCQQTLDPEAVKLLKKIWKYLESDAQLKRDLSQQNLSKKRSILNSIDLDFFDDQMVSFRHLKEHDVELQSLVISYLEQCRNRRELALKMIDSKKVVKVSPLVLLDIINTRINAIIEKLKLESSQLEQQNTLNKINELSQELLTLQHRKILSNNISKIKDYINDLKWADKASKIGGSTSHITKKYKELFDSLVTKEYLKLFEEFLQNLRRYIKVKVVTRGQKGKTIKHIALETDPTVDAEIATPERVLSEGEKRAVALADFLTEVALDITSSTIILDDPVTSLDLEWKEAVASTLFMKQIGDR